MSRRKRKNIPENARKDPSTFSSEVLLSVGPKLQKEEALLCKPVLINDYNLHMNGSDLSAQVRTYTKPAIRCRRYPWVLLQEILSMCVDNAWYLYELEAKTKRAMNCCLTVNSSCVLQLNY